MVALAALAVHHSGFPALNGADARILNCSPVFFQVCRGVAHDAFCAQAGQERNFRQQQQRQLRPPLPEAVRLMVVAPELQP